MDLFLQQWWNDARRFAFVTLLAMAAAAVLTVCTFLYYPREYQSHAKLLLRVGHESATMDPMVDATGRLVEIQSSREHDVFTELEVMRSRVLLEMVVDEIGMETILSGLIPEEDDQASPGMLSRLLSPLKESVASVDPVSDRERAIRKLDKGFGFHSGKRSSVVDVEYRAKSASAAQLITQTWVDAYLKKHNDFHRTDGSLDFFRIQEEELTRLLNEEYERLRAAKTQDNLVTVAGQQKLLEEQLATVQKSLIDTEAALAASQSRLESLVALLKETTDRLVTDEVSGKTNEARDAMRERLFELEVLEREYTAKYKNDHPRLDAVRRQLDEARRIVESQDEGRAEVTSGINPVYVQIETEKLLETALHRSLQDKVKTLHTNQAELREEISTLNRAEQRIAAIERQVQILEKRYAAHSERMEQARIDQSLKEQQISSVNEIQSASLEERPVTPNKKAVAALGLVAILGVFVGVPMLMGAVVPRRAVTDSTERNAWNGSTADPTGPHGAGDETHRSSNQSMPDEPLPHPSNGHSFSGELEWTEEEIEIRKAR